MLAITVLTLAQVPDAVTNAAADSWSKGGFQAVAVVEAAIIAALLLALWRLGKYLLDLITRIFDLTATVTAAAKEATNSNKEETSAIAAVDKRVADLAQELRMRSEVQRAACS